MSTGHSFLFDLAKLKDEGFKVGELLAVDPELLPKLMKHAGRMIRRDETVKNMVFLAGTSAYTKNPINLFLKGPSSIGKTYNTTEMLKYYPRSDVWMLGGLSPTALVHHYGVLVDEYGNEIDFSKKPDKKASEEEKRAWLDMLMAARYVVDLRQKILVFLEAPRIETYMMLRPVLSHDKEEISYKFTDRSNKGGRLRTAHVVIKGWPATIFCTTDEKYVEDLATRGFTVTPEMGTAKYQEAISLTGERKAHPRKFREDYDFMLLQGYFGSLSKRLKDFEVAIPYAEELAEHYPKVYARSMRDFDHFCALIEISALFHYAQRPVQIIVTEKPVLGGKEGETREEQEVIILATMKDFEYVAKLWEHMEETTVTGMPGHILTFYHKAVEPLAEQTEKFTYEELTEKYNEVSEQKKSSWTIRKWVKHLTDIGYLDTEPDPTDKRKMLVKVIKNPENLGDYWNPIFQGSFTLEKFKKWLEDEKKILEKSSVLLKEKLLSEPTSIESLYENHFVSNIFSEPSEAEPKPVAEKKAEIIGFQESQRFRSFKPSEQEAIEYAIDMITKRLPNKSTQDNFIHDLIFKGLSEEEAKKLTDKLCIEGPLTISPEGWLEFIGK